MGAVIGALVDSGYGVAWRVLDSQFFGLAQRRKRVFIVGHLGDVRRAGAVLFDGESVCRDSPPSREARESVAGTLEGRTNGGGFPGSDGAMSGHVVATAYRTSGNRGVMEQGDKTAALNCATDPNQNIVAVTHTLRGDGHNASEDGTGRGAPLLPFTFQPRFARNGRGVPSDVVDALTASESGTHGDSKPHVAVRQGVRRLMPIECERLQGFSDNWTAGFSDSARYRMLGNAVSVPVAEWIARRIMQCT